MGRKKIAREYRKINVCITIDPIIWDMLDEMADSADENHSKFISKRIEEYYDQWIKAMNKEYTLKPHDGSVIE